MTSQDVTLGFKTHTGWAALVAVARGYGSPEVVSKQRLDVATTFEEGAVYHIAQRRPLKDAEALIRAAKQRFVSSAANQIAELLGELAGTRGVVVSAGVVWGSGKAQPSLEAILRSHATVHAAEGELYREVFELACEARGLIVTRIPSRELGARAQAALGLDAGALEARLAELGRSSGRPWAADQKEAALAGLVALFEVPRGSRKRSQRRARPTQT